MIKHCFSFSMLDLDGKLYDAYVAYPSKCDGGYSNDVETFAIQTLPQVLEKACGYKLFIAGRDCQPGQGKTTAHWVTGPIASASVDVCVCLSNCSLLSIAPPPPYLPAAIVDSVEENIEVSRRFLLVYDATTFCGKKRPSSTYSNNNNIVMESQCGDPGGTDGMYFNKTEGISQDPRQRLEVVFATHRALLEGTLKVAPVWESFDFIWPVFFIKKKNMSMIPSMDPVFNAYKQNTKCHKHRLDSK